LDAIVLSAGTGGTIAGIARKIKERLPHVKIVGVDPVGSISAQPESLNGAITSYKVEGIGYDFIPKVLDRSMIDLWIKSEDKSSFIMARRMIKEEGLLVGGSSGSTMHAALQYAKTLKKGSRVVVLLADSVRNYMSKFLSDNWMIENKFMSQPEISGQWWANHTVADLHLESPFSVTPELSCGECLQILTKHGYDQLPVIDKDGSVTGMVTLGNLTVKVTRGQVLADDPVTKAVYTQFRRVDLSEKLCEISQIFDKDHFCLVVKSQKQYQSAGAITERSVVVGVATRIDLLNYILANKPKSSKL